MVSLAFWNCTLPSGGTIFDNERSAFQQFLFNVQPDLLFLTEMSGDFDSAHDIPRVKVPADRERPPGTGAPGASLTDPHESYGIIQTHMAAQCRGSVRELVRTPREMGCRGDAAGISREG